MALLFGLFASRRLALSRPVTSAVNQLKSRMSVLLRRRSFAALAVLGLLNGLLPCGLVYVACAGAAATGGTLAGASYMTAFGVGTVPMMLAISLSGKLVPTSLRLKLVKTIPVCVFLLGTLLILRGMSLGIPYLSPDCLAPALPVATSDAPETSAVLLQQRLTRIFPTRLNERDSSVRSAMHREDAGRISRINRMELVWKPYGTPMEFLWNITRPPPKQPATNPLAGRM